MPTQNPVNWFEIPAADIGRAQTFYETVLGVELKLNDFGGLKMAWFPGVPDGDGATGSLVQNEAYTPSHAGALVYFSVADLDAAVARIEPAGGKVLNPRSDIGEFGVVAHFEDTEGNRVALHADG